jgi:hypothetical protein
MKLSSDVILFVWRKKIPEERLHFVDSFLAPEPSSFAQCGDVRSHHFFWRKPYSVTNKGLKISTSMYVGPQTLTSIFVGSQTKAKAQSGLDELSYLIPLNCRQYSETDDSQPEFKRGQLALELYAFRFVEESPRVVVRIG